MKHSILLTVIFLFLPFSSYAGGCDSLAGTYKAIDGLMYTELVFNEYKNNTMMFRGVRVYDNSHDFYEYIADGNEHQTTIGRYPWRETIKYIAVCTENGFTVDTLSRGGYREEYTLSGSILTEKFTNLDSPNTEGFVFTYKRK